MKSKYLTFQFIGILTLFGLLLSCNVKSDKQTIDIKTDSVIPQDSILKILNEWKSDTSGCLRLRHPDKIKIIIDRYDLIGKDSITLIKYLGEPNTKLTMGDTAAVFYYFMDCSRQFKNRKGDKISSVNFHCEFEKDKLTNTRTPILD